MEYFNPHSSEWLANKFEIYKELRSRDSAYYSEKYNLYVITRYDDVMYALNTPDIFSSAKGNLIVESTKRFGRTLGASDEPEHGIYKNIVRNAYNKEAMQRVAAQFSDQAKKLLVGNRIEISKVIEQLSGWVTAEIVNLPYDKTKIKDLVVDIQRHSSQAVSEDVDDTSYQMYMSLITALLTLTKTPPTGPGVYNEYVNNNPDKIYVRSLFTGPTISGASSLTGALEFLTLDLFRENQLDQLLADRTLIPNAVNESLRFNASTGRFSRTVTKDVTLHNVNLKEGDRVALCLESANRDPKMFADPDTFDLYRNTAGHLAFGHGIHACIALAISKTIMNVYLELLLDIVGKYKVTTPAQEFKYIMTASGNDDMISNLVIEKV